MGIRRHSLGSVRLAEYVWKCDVGAVWCGNAGHIVYVVVDYEYNVVVHVRHVVHVIVESDERYEL